MLDTEEPSMLTTIDNPYNPFTQYDEWFAFDAAKGYHSCAYLARIAIASDELGDDDQVDAVNKAIDEILKENILGKYLKVTEKSFKVRQTSLVPEV